MIANVSLPRNLFVRVTLVSVEGHEEPQLVAQNRPAEGGRKDSLGGDVEVGVVVLSRFVESLVTVADVDGARESVAARFRDHVEDAAGAEAELGL